MLSNASLYETGQLEQVYSWIHDEQRCVTARSVSLELGVSVRVAMAILEDLPYHSQTHGGGSTPYCYEMTRCCMQQEKDDEEKSNTNIPTVKKSTVKLVKSKLEVLSRNHKRQDQDGTIYSLALCSGSADQDGGAPSVQSGHERAMVLLRDLLLDDPNGSSALDPAIHGDSIRPLNPVTRVDLVTSRQMRIQQSSAGAKSGGVAASKSKRKIFGKPGRMNNAASAPPVVSKMKPAVPPRKVTTAAAFFGAHKKASTKSTIEAKPESALKDSSSSTSTGAEGSKKRNSSSSSSSKSKMTQEKENSPAFNTTATSTTTKKPKMAKSTSDDKNKKASNNVGNADDFVGDLDSDDEEFVREDALRKKRNAEAARQQVREQATRKNNKAVSRDAKRIKHRRIVDDDDGDDEKEDESVVDLMEQHSDMEEEAASTKKVGAMDAFATNKETARDSSSQQQQGRPTKKRRKRLEERSVMKDGYLVTETVSVWEDVPSDEEREEQKPLPLKMTTAVKAATPKKKKPQHLKQQGLSAFFTKKK